MNQPAIRVLMLSRFFPPDYSGAGLQALSLATELRTLGHHIEFVAVYRPGLPFEAQQDGFRVTRLEAGRGERHRELRYWWNLIKFLARRRQDFDILHSHGAYYTDCFIGLLGPLFGMRTLAKASLANNDLHSIKNTAYGRLHRWLLRRIDACIAISRDLEREFIAGGANRDKTHLMPNGVDTNRFTPATEDEKRTLRQSLRLPTDQPIALYVGVFDARKNVEWLIREWQAANAFDTGALLVAVGPQSRDDADGRLKDSLIQLAIASPEQLRLIDYSDDIVAFYRAADLFVLPSAREGLPNALLEAMACGLPAVSTDASGNRDLIRDRQTGFLYQVNDRLSFHSAVAAASTREAKEIGRAARRFIEKAFSISALALRYQALYQQLLSK